MPLISKSVSTGISANDSLRISTKTPRKKHSPSARALLGRLKLKERWLREGEEGESRLGAMAKARAGKYHVGYMKKGLGKAYVSRMHSPNKGIL